MIPPPSSSNPHPQELNGLDRPAGTGGSNQKCEEQKSEKTSGRVEEQLEKEKDEKEHHNREINVLEEKAKKLREGLNQNKKYCGIHWVLNALSKTCKLRNLLLGQENSIKCFIFVPAGREMEKEEDDRHKRTGSLSNHEEESKMKHSHVQEEIRRWNQDVLGSKQAAEEARRKKDHLLAKMREIDLQNHDVQDAAFAESNKSNLSSPRPPEQRNQNPSIFSLTETEAVAATDGGSRRLGLEGAGRRALRFQNSSDDLAFGNYAPSFRNPASRSSAGFPPPPPVEDREAALEAIGIFSLRGPETGKDKEAAAKDRKSNLMQQLFGPLGSPAGDGLSTTNAMEVLNCPPNTNGMRPRRERLLSFSSGSSTPPATSISTLQVAESRPAVCAITSFDDDIEELTL